MRHNNKINHLGRTHAHREALLSNMAVSLIKHKRIFTTLAKAKELRKYIEPLITKSKENTTHSRRIVFRNLRDKYAVTELFNDVSQKIGDRPGGYTRIIKLGNRLGDNASTCFIELVDYNDLMLKDKKAPAKTRTRRSKRKADEGVSKSDTLKATTVRKVVAEDKTVESPVIEEAIATPVEDTPVVEVPTAEETVSPEEVADATPDAETPETTETPKEE
ncbi:MAG: 50S ribosomal protein L17 [Dysgonamonadaceae bacterium]|jgi:large subunit ribosomal protein L17|nr:50S ribosomal protein L17 [Dysgonamonadaceae bacterium]